MNKDENLRMKENKYLTRLED